MRSSLKLSTEQKQLQKLIPLQMELGKVLELNNNEMEDLVRATVDENPALEIKDYNIKEVEENFKETSEDILKFDFPNEDEIPAGYISSVRTRTSDAPVIDNILEEDAPTLLDEIKKQLDEMNLSPTVEIICEYIGGCLDSNGYCTRTIEGILSDIVQQYGITVKHEEVKDAFDIIRSLDPPGIGAVNLRDCLLLQLDRKNNSSESVKNARLVVEKYFDVLSNRNYDRILSVSGMTRDELKLALNEILKLDPKPGRLYATNRNEDESIKVSPDFFVEPVDEDNGNFRLSIISNIPELEIEKTFDISDAQNQSKSISAKKSSNETALFIYQKRDEAKNFISLVKMRQETLTRIMEEIINIQNKFFHSYNYEDLKPMVLKDIAMATGFDISVVSRAVNGKYVQTPGGIFSIKSLFNEDLNATFSISSTKPQIEAAIKKIIETEDKQKPLTDDELLSVLNKEGIEIARRTVAKYREKLGFPVARLRKEL